MVRSNADLKGLKLIDSLFEEKKFYDGHQAIRCMHSRKISKKMYTSSISLCYKYAIILAEKYNEYVLAGELGSMMIESYIKSCVCVSDGRVDLICKLFQNICIMEKECTSVFSFMQKAIGWTKKTELGETRSQQEYEKYHEKTECQDKKKKKKEDICQNPKCEEIEKSEKIHKTEKYSKNNEKSEQTVSESIFDSVELNILFHDEKCKYFLHTIGHPRLHYIIGLYYWKFQNYGKAHDHLVLHTGTGWLIGKLINEWRVFGYTSEKEMYVIRSVLMLLALNDLKTAEQLITYKSDDMNIEVFNQNNQIENNHNGFIQFLKKLQKPTSAKDDLDIDIESPLLSTPYQFIYLLISACKTKNLHFYNIIKNKYQLIIRLDTTYDQFLAEIENHIFQNPRNTFSLGRLFGNAGSKS